MLETMVLNSEKSSESELGLLLEGQKSLCTLWDNEQEAKSFPRCYLLDKQNPRLLKKKMVAFVYFHSDSSGIKSFLSHCRPCP